MKQFFYNSIHMTQGKFLLAYWWFWLGLAVVLIGGWMAFDRIVCKINEPETQKGMMK